MKNCDEERNDNTAATTNNANTTTTTNNNNNNMKEMKESQDKLIESVYRISSEIIHHKWLHKQK